MHYIYICIHKRLFLSHKQEVNLDVCDNIDGP